jgi:hypothetical protein
VGKENGKIMYKWSDDLQKTAKNTFVKFVSAGICSTVVKRYACKAGLPDTKAG